MKEVHTHGRPRAMRVLRVVTGLFAVSAVFGMALASAATAAPTALCSASESRCSAEHTYASGRTVEATSTNFKIENTAYPYTCSKATAKLTTQSAVGEPLKTTLTALSLSGCKVAGNSNCTVTTSGLGQPTIESLGYGEAVLGSFGSSSKWVCKNSSGVEIEYGTWSTSGVEFEFVGGASAHIYAESAPITCSGKNCPAEGYLTADFTVNSPKPLYPEEGIEGVGTAGTTLCAVEALYCGEANLYGSGTAVETSLAEPLTIRTSLGNVRCKNLALALETEASGGEPLPLAIGAWGVFTYCGTNEAMSNCTVTAEGSAAGASLQQTVPGSGELTLGTEAPLRFHVTCKGVFGFISIDCKFDLESHATLSGGNHATIEADDLLEKVSGSPLCPKDDASELEAIYQVTSLSPLYVTG